LRALAAAASMRLPLFWFTGAVVRPVRPSRTLGTACLGPLGALIVDF
jgi:hypothetical protein